MRYGVHGFAVFHNVGIVATRSFCFLALNVNLRSGSQCAVLVDFVEAVNSFFRHVELVSDTPVSVSGLRYHKANAIVFEYLMS